MNLVYEILKIRVKKRKSCGFWDFFACQAEVEFTCDFLNDIVNIG